MTVSRDVAKMKAYDGLATQWDHVVNRYDLEKRLSVVFDQLLGGQLSGLRLLDAGCAVGYFSQRAAALGADVVSLDIGPNLLVETASRCPSSKRVCGDLTALCLRAASFDIVVCTEVIEHTTTPVDVMANIYRVLRPGGVLALTVPNRVWKWSVVVANALHMRPYEGLENWQGYLSLRKAAQRIGYSIEDWFGFNLLPFQFRLLQTINRVADPAGYVLGPCMINIAARLRKPIEART